MRMGRLPEPSTILRAVLIDSEATRAVALTTKAPSSSAMGHRDSCEGGLLGHGSGSCTDAAAPVASSRTAS